MHLVSSGSVGSSFQASNRLASCSAEAEAAATAPSSLGDAVEEEGCPMADPSDSPVEVEGEVVHAAVEEDGDEIVNLGEASMGSESVIERETGCKTGEGKGCEICCEPRGLH
jgi:hypothetical protein